MTLPFEEKRYYAMALDPVHIGTGGYRLGRVDNTIVREPATNLPKIPGSSIAGAARAYTAMAVQSGFPLVPKKQKYQRMRLDAEDKPIAKKRKDGTPETDSAGKTIYEYDSCAGKGANDGEGHCGKPDCEVCTAFGFSKKNSSFQGLSQFSDARILFFPVHSMIGPVWITSPAILKEHSLDVELQDTNGSKFKCLGAPISDKRLSFGWLMLESEGSEKIDVAFSHVPDEIGKRLVLVSERLFSHIVNDNLEVRTSVAIDPLTGAAVDGALYTYEAVPRATVMWFDVAYSNPEYFRVDGQEIRKDGSSPADTGWVKENVEKGLRYLEPLGVGGMNTRGMGRLRVLSIGG